MCRFRVTSRQKVTIGYYVVGALVFTLSVLIFIEIKFIEKQMAAYDTISGFFDTTLEIRRFEKNYFLYGQESDYHETVRYVTAARESLEENYLDFTSVADPRQVKLLRESMAKYKELLRQYADMKEEDRRTFLEGGIRKLGRDIVTAAQDISKSERSKIQATLKNSRTFLAVSIVILSILGAGIFQILSKTVVQPPGDRIGD
ncbi:MAG TPA: hypothetical protein VF790_06300 [Dissulfurispiraceae bacterium]